MVALREAAARERAAAEQGEAARAAAGREGAGSAPVAAGSEEADLGWAAAGSARAAAGWAAEATASAEAAMATAAAARVAEVRVAEAVWAAATCRPGNRRGSWCSGRLGSTQSPHRCPVDLRRVGHIGGSRPYRKDRSTAFRWLSRSIRCSGRSH